VLVLAPWRASFAPRIRSAQAILVMLRGAFGKITAYLGLATGILGIVSLMGTSLTMIGNALFATAWLF
jgi:hypothetical protein